MWLGGKAVLVGRVIDAESGQGISGATLYLREAGSWSGSSGSGPCPEYAVYVSDAMGVFCIEGLRDRRYHLDAEAPGFLRFLSTVAEGMSERYLHRFPDDLHFESGIVDGHWHEDWDRVFGNSQLLCAAFPRVQGGSTPSLTLHLRRGQTLRGTVKDGEGQPLSGATITIDSQGFDGYHPGPDYWGLHRVPSNRPVATDTEGRFALTVAPGSRLRLLFKSPGRPEERRTFDLLSHEGPIDVAMGGGRKLHGRIVDPPQHDVRIVVFEPKVGGRVWESTSGPAGAFAVDGLVGERWVLLASAHPCGGATVLLVESLDAPLELQLQNTRYVEGQIVDPAGAPQGGALIGQEVILRHSSFTARLDAPCSEEENRVVAHPDGSLQVPAWLQAGHAMADADGHFRMETILGQQDEVHLHAHTHDTTVASMSGQGWFRLKVPAVIVVAERTRDASGKGPRVHDLDVHLAQLKSGPVESRRGVIVALRHELNHGTDRLDLLPHFLLGLADEDPEVCLQAVLALGELKRPETFEPLVGALRHAVWSVKHYAIYGLEQFGARAAPRLREIKESEPNPSLRVTAAAILVRIGEAVAPEIFYEALRGDDNFHGTEAEAVAKLGRKEAIALLIDAMRRSTSDYALQKALQQLTGLSESWGARRWQHWLEENGNLLPPQVAIETVPHDVDGYRRLAHRLYKQGHPERALECYSRALELDPKDVKALRWRGFLRLQRGELETAERDFTQLLDLAPERPSDWLARAQARVGRKNTAGARSDLEKALAIAPADWPLHETAKRMLLELP